MNKTLKIIGGAAVLSIVAAGLVYSLSPAAKKSIQIAALDKIGDAATQRMASSGAGEPGSVAADFINIPIIARQVAPNVYQATGVANAHIVKTTAGDVLFDTGLSTQVPKQMKALKAALPDLNVDTVIVSHSHADHSGGVKFWADETTTVIAHAEFEEEQRYLTELQPYFWGRNKTLFPFMPDKPPTLGLIAYGGIKPTQVVRNGAPYAFNQGGVDFELIALPGAEGADNLVLWLPQSKTLLSGDFFGPLFPQFPNIFTMRGEKIRKPAEYIRSLNTVIELSPDIIVPSHKDPITDKSLIMDGLVTMRDATAYVHDAVVAGMNAGKTLETLMVEIQLPPNLALTQEHGKVSWAVKSIWEYYATWFHFDKTTELYAVAQSEVHGDIVTLAGADALILKAKTYAANNQPLRALHLIDIVLSSSPSSSAALAVRETALLSLMERAQSGEKNSYEIYWLNYRLRETRAAINGPETTP